MKHILLLALITACKAKTEDGPTAHKIIVEPVTTDPWAAKAAPKVDASKDPDLAMMTELARGTAGKDSPQADAVIATLRDDFTLKPDGTVVHHTKSIVKLLDAQRAKEKFADVHLTFDGTKQSLVVDTARTVNSDGEAHVVSPDEIGDIVPEYLAGATIYSHVRERVISFPAVDKGSVIELETTRTTKPGPDSPMGAEVLIGRWDPIVDRTITVTAPAGTVPTFAGSDVKPTESDGANGHTWTFHIANQPDRAKENESPEDDAVLPRLVISFEPSWAKVLEPIAARFIDKLAVTAEIKATAEQVVGDAKTPTEKAQRLFAFVAHDIRTVNVPLGFAGYEPHPPADVLANKYGDSRDKVGLLLALAAVENIQGRAVLVRSGNVPVLQSAPTLAQFDHIIAKLVVDQKDVWLNPADEAGQYDIVLSGQDSRVLPLEKGGAELGQRTAGDPSASVSHVTAKYILAANGDLDATYDYELTGWFADRATEHLRSKQGENLDRLFQDAAGTLSAIAVDKGHAVGDTMSSHGAFSVTQHVAVQGYSAAQGKFRNFEMPPITLGVASALPNAGLAKRKYPLWIGTPRIERGDVTVAIPSGWKVAYVPDKLEGAVDGVAYSSACEANGQTVSCHDEIKLDKLELDTAHYAAFHDALAKLQAYERRVVLLTKA